MTNRQALAALAKMPVLMKLWQLTVTYAATAATFFFIGLVVFGWWLWPVQWEAPAGLNAAPHHSKVQYVHLVSEWYAYTQSDETARYYMGELDDSVDIACYLADNETTDLPKKARYIKIAWLKNGTGCK